jgi:hypothetical protein
MHDEIKPNSITLVCGLEGQINILNSYAYLPVSRLYDKKGDVIVYETIKDDGKKKRLKMPFFGYNNIIVTCRMSNMTRGCRIKGKQFQNVLTIDYQLHNKNYNLKISSKKIQLTGALSEESGKEVYIRIITYIRSVQDLLTQLQNLSDDQKIKYKNEIIEHIYHKKSYTIEKDIIDYFKLIQDFPIDDKTGLDKQHLCYTESEFSDKIDTLFEGIKLYTGELNLDLSTMDVVNAFFTHSIKNEDGDLPLALLFNKLHPQFNCSFHNCISTQIRVTIGCKTKPENFHRFFIFTTGTINQHSPTFYPESYKQYYRVITAIEKALEEIKDELIN